MNAVKSDVEKLVQKELESANQRFPMFRSDHEGAAVIFEEIQEAEYEFECAKDRFQELWRSVKCNLSSEWIAEINVVIMNRAINLACEAIQVAAMAQKFIDSQKRGRIKMNEEMLFVACNIPNLLEKMLKDVRNQSCENMTKENLDGYDYAVETALSMIKQIIYSAEMDNETLVHSDKINDEHDSEEFDLHGLLELLGCRAVAQFSEREGRRVRVISKRGEYDIPYELSVFWRDENIIWANAFGTGKIIFAQYSSKGKAKKAMQKLHEAYATEPLFIHKDVSPDERAAAGEISWAQALDEMHTGMFVRPIPDSSIEQVYTGNIVFRFPQEDEI